MAAPGTSLKFLFTSQAESLRLFDGVRVALGLTVDRAGFIVADRLAYARWLQERADFESGEILLCKEWEVTARPLGSPDLASLAAFEAKLGGEPGLFGAVVADRRLFMGPDCTYSQDYRRRYTDDELLFILQRGCERMEQVFDELRPDVLVGFICVTMLDYLAYLFARARGVRVLNLRPTRVADYVSFNSTLNDPSPEFARRFAQLADGATSPNAEKARAHIARVREQDGRYEGVVSPSDKPALRLTSNRGPVLGRAAGSLRNYLEYRAIARTDNHVPNPLRSLWFAGLVNPWRARLARRNLRSRYLPSDRLAGLRYIFYPLHTEPEVSLLVYGRPYVNQIEILRWLAMSLPADAVLVVKEHPWMVGKRSMGAYRKMLDIPRVHLVDPSLNARALIQSAAMVAVVTGSVALEAAILRKPVVTFGDCPYNLLPPDMVRRCEDPRQLPRLVSDMLARFCCDDNALQRYVSAVMDTGARVNLYSILLGKKNVYAEQRGEYQLEVAKLTEYLRAELAAPAIDTPVAGAARW